MNLRLPTYEELRQFVHQQDGVEFLTSTFNMRFTVALSVKGLEICSASQKPRVTGEKNINLVLERLAETGSLRPGNYKEDSFNASYILALILAWQKMHQGPSAALPHRRFSLTKDRKDQLAVAVHHVIRHRSWRLRGGTRTENGLEIERNLREKERGVGAIYWSSNAKGNDVEIAFKLEKLAEKPWEKERLPDWFVITANAMKTDIEANNHSNKHASWYRAGFSFIKALEFFELLKNRVDPCIHGFQNSESSSTLATSIPPVAQRPESLSVQHMLQMAKQACGASGQSRTSINKVKEYLLNDDIASANSLFMLLKKQNNRCAVTQLPLQFKGRCEDEEMLASLDRIDSNGHYQLDNLQIVCRFVNRWKADDSDQNFRRLIKIVKNIEISDS